MRTLLSFHEKFSWKKKQIPVKVENLKIIQMEYENKPSPEIL